MKQFIVDRHTTPGTPAMDPVAVPKIPVYDDLAAAEADLSNLHLGQLVATEDTGLSFLTRIHKITTTTNGSAQVKYVDLPDGFTEANTYVVAIKLIYNNSLRYAIDKDIQVLITNDNTNKVGIVVSNSGFYSKTIDVILLKV